MIAAVVATGGMVLGKAEPMGRVRAAMIRAGTNLGPFDAWLATRGARTLSVRVERQSANALALAGFLDKHRAVSRVYYPGLSSHPQRALAKRLMPGPAGPMLSFDLAGGALAVERPAHGVRAELRRRGDHLDVSRAHLAPARVG